MQSVIPQMTKANGVNEMPTRDDGDDEGKRMNETPVEASELHTETTTRDDWRAKRYVETVKPAMAALRYDPEIEDMDGDVQLRKAANPP